MNKQSDANRDAKDKKDAVQKTCGIVMPISHIDGYDIGHWDRVRRVIDRAVVKSDMVPRLVSESEETAIIHASIVQNLYDDEIVIVDVSGKNPNVMFELGLRLAFDKPTVIIKDDQTSYSFDTSPIKHIGYRSDLRFDDVEDLENKLTKAIISSREAKQSKPEYSPFLGNFGKFVAAKVDTTELPASEYVIETLTSLQRDVAHLTRALSRSDTDLNNSLLSGDFANKRIIGLTPDALRDIMFLAFEEVDIQDPMRLSSSEAGAVVQAAKRRLITSGFKVPADSVLHTIFNIVLNEWKAGKV
ncbi:hypothetical protein [Neorhizobium vignae]|uniref:hypothetical protein n=1 Tax=Neorhizobium vignae TaxID=690585 RepID=UPI000689B42D|nr:hypothetical protein [Neorhizobium vignae]